MSLAAAGNIVGRDGEIERLLQHSRGGLQSAGLLLMSEPGAGASELLRQTYDRIFFDEAGPIPFYFAFRAGEPVESAGRRFVLAFIQQAVAFTRQDPALVAAAPGFSELSELALPRDGHWIDRLIEHFDRDIDSQDSEAFVRFCFSSVLRASSEGLSFFAMIDGVHHAGEQLFREIRDIFRISSSPYVLSGRRRFFRGVRSLPSMRLNQLVMQDACELIERLGAVLNIKINEQCRDLIAVQLGCSPGLITNFLFTASEIGNRLESFELVEQAYAESLFNGNIGQVFDSEIALAAGSADAVSAVAALLCETANAGEGRISEAVWARGLGLDQTAAARILKKLDVAEIIRYTTAGVEAPDTIPLLDHIAVRFRLEVAGENRTLVFARSLADYLRRAPELMAHAYRENAALGISEMLRSFRSQAVPLALIDYGKFRDEFRGAPDEEILAEAKHSGDVIRLPQVFFVAATADFYRPIELVTERSRSAVAIGFEPDDEAKQTESAWIAAEIDSKLEAGRELAEFWCDRLEMAAIMCDFRNYRIWLVSPEGFTDEALDILRQRQAHGSSRKQFELLRTYIGGESDDPASREYEIVLPIGEDAELIAAHTAEDIAKRHNFDAHSINQIKTALVEACINAAEHSLSPDGKIYQKFIIEDDKIVITVSNRGLRLSGRAAEHVPSPEGRRGWGLTLMRRLMDEVTVEDVDDGTRISMTKYLKLPA